MRAKDCAVIRCGEVAGLWDLRSSAPSRCLSLASAMLCDGEVELLACLRVGEEDVMGIGKELFERL